MNPRFNIRSLVCFIVLASLTAGCHTVPLGDPEKSAARPELKGWWRPDKPGSLVYVSPYDSRTYIVTLYVYDEAPALKPKCRSSFKAWMTRVAGMDVLCCKTIDPEWDLEMPDPLYLYLRISKAVGVDAGAMEVTVMNVSFLKDATTPDELEKKITANVKNPELWKGGDGFVLHPVPALKIDEVVKIVKLFAPPDQVPFAFFDARIPIH